MLGGASVVRLYKGVGPGTFHHGTHLQTTGIVAHRATAAADLQAVVQHVAYGPVNSPLISLTSSYAVAAQYALVGTHHATSGSPGYVYQIDVPDPLPLGARVHDAALYIAAEILKINNSLSSIAYRHNGDRAFLLSIVDPGNFGHLKYIPPAVPKGNSSSNPPTLTIHLEAMVNALRDAEVFAVGTVPQNWITARHDVP